MKGILVHSTTIYNLESILEDGALFDSSKTESEFDDSDEYQELLKNKIFFQLVPETIDLTGDIKKDRGFNNEILLFFDIQMLEDFGKKKYTKSAEQKEKLTILSESKRFVYETNEIPKQKVWFNPGWFHGGFHLVNRKGEKYSENYNKDISIEENIQNFYEFQNNYRKNDIDSDKKLTNFKSEAKNEVVFQAKKINLDKYLLAIYSYNPKKVYKELIEEYKSKGSYKFLKTPKELKEFWKNYKS